MYLYKIAYICLYLCTHTYVYIPVPTTFYMYFQVLFMCNFFRIYIYNIFVNIWIYIYLYILFFCLHWYLYMYIGRNLMLAVFHHLINLFFEYVRFLWALRLTIDGIPYRVLFCCSTSCPARALLARSNTFQKHTQLHLCMHYSFKDFTCTFKNILRKHQRMQKS